MSDPLELTSRAEATHFWFRGFREFVTPVISDLSAGRRDLRIIDCGCGTGHNLRLLSRFGRAVGFDLNDGGVKMAACRWCGCRSCRRRARAVRVRSIRPRDVVRRHAVSRAGCGGRSRNGPPRSSRRGSRRHDGRTRDSARRSLRVVAGGQAIHSGDGTRALHAGRSSRGACLVSLRHAVPADADNQAGAARASAVSCASARHRHQCAVSAGQRAVDGVGHCGGTSCTLRRVAGGQLVVGGWEEAVARTERVRRSRTPSSSGRLRPRRSNSPTSDCDTRPGPRRDGRS